MSSENRIRNRTTQIGIAPQGGEVHLIDMSARTWDRRIRIARQAMRIDEKFTDPRFDPETLPDTPPRPLGRREMNTSIWHALGLLEGT